MRNLVPSLILVAALTPMTIKAQITQPDNSVDGLFGDSLMVDGDPTTAPQTGWMFQAYWEANRYSMNPQNTNMMFDVGARSGGLMSDQATAEAELLCIYAFNRLNGINGTNFGITEMTQNGNFTSNAMYYACSNNWLFPVTMTNGVANTNEGGYANDPYVKVAWMGLANAGGNGANAGYFGNGQDDKAREDSVVKAIADFNQAVAARTWTASSNAAVTDFNLNGGSDFYVLSAPQNPAKVGHFRPELEWYWEKCFERLVANGDTNIANRSISWNSASVISTNHCCVWNVSVSGNVMTMSNLDLRRPGAWEIKGLGGDGLMYTNDCSAAYTVVDPSAANWFKYDITIPDCPSGNYDIRINGVLAAQNVSYLTLRSGWNMWTNTVGPIWDQRHEVWGRVLDVAYVNRTNRVQGPSGDGIGLAGLGSLLFGTWPTKHGDSLVTDHSITNYIWGLKTNSTRSFNQISAASVITANSFSISNDAPGSGYTPAPFR